MNNKGIMMRYRFTCLMLVALMALAGCGQTGGGGSSSSGDDEDSLTSPTSITVTVSTVNVFIGLTRQYSVTVSPDGASTAVTWSIDDTDSATISATISTTGLVTGISTGSVTVTATSILAPSVSGEIAAEVASVQWTQYDDATWSVRRGHSVLVHDDK
ncbi:MAG: Ig-like domain-containing protein, partial [bacterium]|nr:Ig-like domain-containing protein [bacterium]